MGREHLPKAYFPYSMNFTKSFSVVDKVDTLLAIDSKDDTPTLFKEFNFVSALLIWSYSNGTIGSKVKTSISAKVSTNSIECKIRDMITIYITFDIVTKVTFSVPEAFIK